MKTNKVREYRKKKGLTQRQLAEMIGTSQQQVQRIEAGAQTVRIDMATSLCDVLEQNMFELFPETKPLKKKLEKFFQKKQKNENEILDEKLIDELEEADIVTDPTVYSIKILLANNKEHFFDLTKHEYQRVFKSMQREHDAKNNFVVFDSEGDTIVLNLDHVLYIHFLWDPLKVNIPDEKRADTVEVHLYGMDKHMEFEVEMDDTDDYEDSKLCVGPLSNLISIAEEYDIVGEKMFSVEDIDGEWAFFNAKNTMLIKIPISKITTDFEDRDDEDLYEEELIVENTEKKD